MIAKAVAEAHLAGVSRKPDVDAQSPGGAWTRPDAYVEALAKRRTFRRARENKPRTQTDTPRMLLSTVPFLGLIMLLAILAIAIMVIAFPGSQPAPRPQTAAKERGVAARGWFQEAQKQFHK